VIVAGASMEPALSEGDRLLIGRAGPCKVGDIVALRDPANPRRVIVKRIVALRRDEVVLRGDNAAASTDSRHFGPVSTIDLMGKVLRRYGPPHRASPMS